MKLKPVGNWIYFKKRDFLRETPGGLVLPNQTTTPFAEVTATGPGKYVNGALIPMSCKPGDLLVLNVDRLQALIHEVNLPGEEMFYIVQDEGGVVCGVIPAEDVPELERQFGDHAKPAERSPKLVLMGN